MNATMTDVNGKFSLSVADDAVIVISYIGFLTQEFPVTGQSNYSIEMQEDVEVLEEVVVVGFGTQKKANLTGAVTTVKMDEVMGDRPLTSATAALQGAVPGLLVTSNGNAAGSSQSLQIRGAYSIGSESTIAPLVLIDNVEGDITLLNPDDIESVTVMKDAASSAVYGARAAGGVILVTTKRPTGETRFQLNYNNNFAWANAINLPQQASLTDYFNSYLETSGDAYWTLGAPSVTRWMELLDQYKKNPSSLDVRGDGIYKEDGALYFLHEKSLQKNITETSFQHTHNLSVSGGTDRLRFRLSGGYLSKDGVLVTNKDTYTRLNVNAFLSADITKWFTQEATISYAHSKDLMPVSGESTGFYNIRLVSFYPEGLMPEGYGVGGDDNLPFFTPLNQILYSNQSKTLNDNPRIFLKSRVMPIKGLEFDFEYTFDKNVYDYHYYTGSVQYTTAQGGSTAAPSSDYLRKYKSYTDYNAINVYGTYAFDIKKAHNFKVMAGFNQEWNYNEIVDDYSYLQAVTEVPSLGGGTGTISAKDYYYEYAIRGGFFRVNYDYKERYLLEVDGRYDGSSKFPTSSRFGFFPSFSVGWNITQEPFMEKTRKVLDLLKVRASFGEIGNQNIDPYTFVPSMTLNNTYTSWLIDNGPVTAVTSLPDLVSSTFTWEKVWTTNVGLDLTMFQNRLNGIFEWYQKNTTGMLSPGFQLPAVVGADAPYQNTADMRTRGWEISLNWRDKIGKVGYNVGFNLSDYKSVVTKYDDNDIKLISDYYEGMVLGEIWGYVYDGFYSVDDFVDTNTWQLKDGVVAINGYSPRPGDVKFKNLRDDAQGDNLIYAGDGTVDNPGDRKIIGNSLPRLLYGITLGVNYAGFDLSIFMQGVGKRDYWIANALTFPRYSDYQFIPLYAGTENYWRAVDWEAGDYTNANPDAKFPRIYNGYGNQGSNYRTSDKYLSDASYFRIKNITLAYQFPKKWINKIMLQQLKAFVSVENPLTVSKLPSGIDPETLSWSYPAFCTISFGINLTL